MLKLESLTIRAIHYGAENGRFKGTIEYVGQYGKVELILTPEACAALLPVVASAIIESSKQVASELTVEAFESSKE